MARTLLHSHAERQRFTIVVRSSTTNATHSMIGFEHSLTTRGSAGRGEFRHGQLSAENW
jgi:hypothetical protein